MGVEGLMNLPFLFVGLKLQLVDGLPLAGIWRSVEGVLRHPVVLLLHTLERLIHILEEVVVTFSELEVLHLGGKLILFLHVAKEDLK